MNQYAHTLQVFQVDDNQIANGDYVLDCQAKSRIVDVVVECPTESGWSATVGINENAGPKIQLIPGSSKSFGPPNGYLEGNIKVNFLAGGSGTKKALVYVWKQGLCVS